MIYRTPLAMASSALLLLGACGSDSKSSTSTAASTTVSSSGSTPATVTTTEPAATTTAVVVKGFAQHFSTELTLPDASKVQIDGDVALSSGVVAAETGIVGTSHLVMFPKVTASFTNASAGGSVTLSRALVEMFLDQSIAHDCVLNVADTKCDDAIIYSSAANSPPLNLAAGATFDLADDGNGRIIDVPDETADQLVHNVSDGTIVTGYAVVIVGATGDAVATTIFNREGKAVVTCPALPVDCMDATRSVLG